MILFVISALSLLALSMVIAITWFVKEYWWCAIAVFSFFTILHLSSHEESQVREQPVTKCSHT